jgi:aldehyde:ferredoxin oxidoreductase
MHHEPDHTRADRRPRILEIDLARFAVGRAESARAQAWRGSNAAVDRVGCLGGGALASAVLHDAEFARRGCDAPLVLALGECVRDGTPTAARLTIASRAPLTGRLADGQVGSDLARRLASLADALVLSGRTQVPGAVLEIDARGQLRLHSWPELAGLSSRDVHARVCERTGACASLSVGAAGERELPIASLAAGGDGPHSGVPHFVGRGGLGAVFGRLGLRALVVTCAPIAQQSSGEMIDALRRSPRLSARAVGGTLELFSAFDARDELRARNYSAPVPHEQAERLDASVASLPSARHGCQGCPTPCGWVFDTRKRPQGARFGASYALGLNLGLERFEDSLALLADCDELGVDAKEVGAMLALLCRARELGRIERGPSWGDVEALRRALRELCESPTTRGALELAREFGLEHEHFHAKRSALRPDANLATLLGQCVSSRGTDPMRTFAFLLDGADRAQLERLLAMPLPEGADDPRSPAGKGRIVWWHENLAAALDATGFCAFSAAALLADGTLELDRLARWIAPSALRGEPGFERSPGAALLAAGAGVVALQRDLDQLWNGAPSDERPAWARAQLDQPGMWDEYAALRGLGASAAIDAGALEVARTAPANAEAPSAPCAGRVVVRCGAVLSAVLGREREHSADLPATAESFVRDLARGSAAAQRVLVRDGHILPALYRDGRRLVATDLLRDGDALDLVLVVSGG